MTRIATLLAAVTLATSVSADVCTRAVSRIGENDGAYGRIIAEAEDIFERRRQLTEAGRDLTRIVIDLEDIIRSMHNSRMERIDIYAGDVRACMKKLAR